MNIDTSKLKRDYVQNPLNRFKVNTPTGYTYEKPFKEDLEYLVHELKLTNLSISEYLQCPPHMIKLFLRHYGIKRSKKLCTELKKTGMMQKYGVENPSLYKECCQKRERMFIQKYGVENPFASKEIQNKIKQTNLERYGVEKPLQNKHILKKQLNTMKEKYNVEHYINHKDYEEKYKQTCLKKYGVDNHSKSPLVQNKIKQTNLERYGVEYYMQTNQYKDLYKNSSFVQNKEQKSYLTKKGNGSLGKSKQEENIFSLLCQKFPNTIHHYKSELYPFPCDFYIPELNLYIEYQGFYMHGNEPYMNTDEQKEIVKLWESKNTVQYKRAINTWTIRDPLKRKTAKDNNLNWIEFFTMEEFMKWYNNIEIDSSFII